MKIRPGLVVFLLALVCATSARGAPLPDDFDPATMMRAAEVRPGMIAVGKSVFKGTRIEEFRVRLISVLPKARVGTDLVLCEILDGPPVERKAGLIAGMSGSPVYVNGKLLGAIGYGWTFTREAIGAITPIENMLRAWEPVPESQARSPSGSVELSAPVSVGGRTIQRVNVEPTFGPPQGVEAPGTLTLRPLGGLCMVAGFQGRALERLREVLEPLGLTPMQGGAGMKDFGTPEMLVPGGAVGVKLMEGDLEMAGVGTLTYRKGDRILAFGHPFMDLTDPEIDFGMAAGYVHDVLPSIMSSAKLSSVGRILGTINRDRMWAIGGQVGRGPDMMPLALQVNGGGNSRSFQVRMARYRTTTPGLAASAVMTLVDQTLGYMGEGTAEVAVTLVPRGREPIQRRDLVYSRDVSAALTMQVAEPLAAFTDTPYGSVEFERIDIAINVRIAHDTAAIERIYTTQTKAKAGKDLDLNIVLRPFGQEKITRKVTLHIPADMPTGRLRVGVSGGRDAERMRQALNLARIVPTSLDQLVQRYRIREAANQLVVQVALPTRGVRLPDRTLPSLPGSVGGVLLATRSSDISPVSDSHKEVLDTDWVIHGRQVITVMVEGRPGAPKAGPPPPPRPPEGVGPPEEGEPDEEPDGDEESALAAPDALAAWPVAAPPPAARGGPAAPDKKPEKKPETPKPVIRQPARWVHASRADFEKGKLRGTALDSDGILRLAPARDRTWPLPAQAVWSLAAADDAAYAGTGNAGVIYKLTEDGEPSTFFETGQAIVHSLARDPAGALYAGTSPKGLVYKIDPEGKGSVFFDTGQTYVWALALDADGRLLAGTGPEGKVFRIGPDGQGDLFADCRATHILSLALGRQGEVYAGTGNNAVVYRLAADGGPTALFNLPGGQVHGLAVDDGGELYAAVTPAGAVYRIKPNGGAERRFEIGDNPVFALARHGPTLYAATGGKGLVFRLRGEKDTDLLLKPETGQSLALALGPGGDLYVGRANPTAVRRLGTEHRASGHFLSDVVDAGAVARWGRLTWHARTPEKTRAALQTRSGNTTDPEDRWSQWSDEIETPGRLIASPPARYLQYRVNLSTEDSGAGPEVGQIEIAYLAENRKPKVTLSKPEPGDWWAKKQKIEWKGQDPDKDTLLYDVSYSVDQSAHWESLEKATKDASFEWDTAKIEDGLYTVKVTATDRLTSPADPQTEEVKRLVGLDNTEPEAWLLRHSVTVGEDRRATLRGQAWDETSAVRGVDYRADGKEWLAATPDDGMFDGPRVSFSITTDQLAAGDHTIEVRALDGAGNIGTHKLKVEVKRPPPPPKKPAEPETSEEPAPAEPEPSETPAPAEAESN